MNGVIIRTIYNAPTKGLSFIVNEKDYGIALDNIQHINDNAEQNETLNYRLAVYMNGDATIPMRLTIFPLWEPV